MLILPYRLDMRICQKQAKKILIINDMENQSDVKKNRELFRRLRHHNLNVYLHVQMRFLAR